MEANRAPEGAEAAMCWGPCDESSPLDEQRVFHWDPEFFHSRERAGTENEQSVNDYKAQKPPIYGEDGRTIVYIMPLGPCWSHSFAQGEGNSSSSGPQRSNSVGNSRDRNDRGSGKRGVKEESGIVPPQLDIVRRYLAAFFYGIPVVLLDPVPVPSGRRKAPAHPDTHLAEVRTRLNENNPPQRKSQRYAPDMLEWMKLKTPSDTWCVIGLTHYDLYGSASSNHCLGASSMPGAAVISFARLDPSFYGNSRPAYAKRLLKGVDVVEDQGRDTAGGNCSSKSDHWYLWMLKRVCRLSAHEMLHALGMKHCSVFQCLLNPEGIHELDDVGKSLLCPICLKKFQVITNVDILKRYQSMAGFCQDFSFVFGAEGMWICGRHEWIAHGLSCMRLPMFTPSLDTQAGGDADPPGEWKRGRHEPPTQAITATVPQLRSGSLPSNTAKSRRSSSVSRGDSSAEAMQTNRNAIWSLDCTTYG